MECPFKVEIYANVAYIKQLRPITPDDFILVNPVSKPNALDFINDDPWDFRSPKDINYKTPSFAATVAVEFLWLQEIENQYNSHIPFQDIENKDQLKSFMDIIRRTHKESYAFITHSFDWTGCRSEESRQRKLRKNKEIFETKFQENKNNKERNLINATMKRCITSLDYVNDSFSHKLLNKIDYSTEKADTPSLSEEEATLRQELLLLQEKMNPINQRLREIRDEKFRNRVDQIIIHIEKDDFSYQVKTKLIEGLKDKKEKGVPRRPQPIMHFE